MAFSVFYRVKDGELLIDKENEPYIKKTCINTCVRYKAHGFTCLSFHKRDRTSTCPKLRHVLAQL